MTSPARPLWRNPGWLLFALLALAPPLALLLRPAPEPLPHLGRLPEFSVVDQSGEPLTRASFAGHVVVLDFIFTRCPDICPTLTAQMAALRAVAGPEQYAMLSAVLDPAVGAKLGRFLEPGVGL